MLGRDEVDLKTAQELAGHSTPDLTARYTHCRLHDLAGSVGNSRSLLLGDRTYETESLRLTVTEPVRLH